MAEEFEMAGDAKPRPTVWTVVLEEEMPERPPTTSLDRIERWAKVGSILAIPIIVGFVGWMIQDYVRRGNEDKEYIAIAIHLLEKPDTKPELRQWAVSLLRQHSDLPLDWAVLNSLSAEHSPFPSPRYTPRVFPEFKLGRVLANDYLRDEKAKIVGVELSSGAFVAAKQAYVGPLQLEVSPDSPSEEPETNMWSTFIQVPPEAIRFVIKLSWSGVESDPVSGSGPFRDQPEWKHDQNGTYEIELRYDRFPSRHSGDEWYLYLKSNDPVRATDLIWRTTEPQLNLGPVIDQKQK
jgi:hypothetical protein